MQRDTKNNVSKHFNGEIKCYAVSYAYTTDDAGTADDASTAKYAGKAGAYGVGDVLIVVAYV